MMQVVNDRTVESKDYGGATRVIYPGLDRVELTRVQRESGAHGVEVTLIYSNCGSGAVL